ERQGVGGGGLVQHLRGYEAGGQARSQSQQAAEPLVFVAELGQEGRGEGGGVPLRQDHLEAGSRSPQQLRLPLQLEQRGENGATQHRSERIADAGGQPHRREREGDAPQKQERVRSG